MQSGGIDLTDPERVRSLIDRLVQLVGEEVVRAIYPHALVALRDNRFVEKIESLLPPAMAAYVVSECVRFPAGAGFAKRLRDRAAAGEFSAFFDTLFEGEAALYWHQQMHAHLVEFPSTPHPDFWASVTLQGHHLRIANECKRIAPVDAREAAADELSQQLEAQVRRIYASTGAIKVIVWLHVPAADADRAALFQALNSAAADATTAPHPPRWHTASDREGCFQVSVAADPEHGAWAEREIRVSDVPAIGPLRVAVETRYLGKPQDPVRLKYVLSVRSDVLPNRVGAFERNLFDAVQQVALSPQSTSGAVNIRLRPPRDIGDLYEADAIVRRVLTQLNANHIGLVILYWNDAERVEEQQGIDGSAGRVVRAQYSLKAHFIAHHPSPIDFASIDSGTRTFAKRPEILIRDPETGSLTSLDPALLNLMQSQPSLEAEPTEDQNAATIYMRLHEPFPARITRHVIQPIRAADRTFLPTFDEAQHIRIIEFRGAEPLRVATMDLRAWSGETELLFHLKWANEPWTVAATCPRAREKVVVRSVPLRRTFF